MARQKEFDPETIEHRAMELFWLKGYKGTSLQDLISHLGISKGSLYSVYPGKKALFKKAFQHYIETVGMKALLPLRQHGNPRDRIKQVFSIIAEQISNDPHRRGCLMVNTITETAGKDPELLDLTAAAQERVRKLFASCLAGLFEGRQKSAVRIEADSYVLLTLFLGLRVLAKTGPDKGIVENIVEKTLEGIV